MKTIIFLLLVLCGPTYAYAQVNLSKSDTKGITIKEDEFSNNTYFSSRQTGLFVVSDNGEQRLNWTFNTMDTNPLIMQSITIKVNDEYFNIDFSEYDTNEYTQTPVSTTYFYSEVTVRAEGYIDVIEKIINSKEDVSIRYSVFSFQQNRIIDGRLNKKYRQGLAKILNIYKKLHDNGKLQQTCN